MLTFFSVSRTLTMEDFVWSLRPLILLFRILGIDLSDRNNFDKRSRHWYIILYTMVCFFLNLGSQVDVMKFFFENLSTYELAGVTKLQTITAFASAIIEYVNYTIYGVFNHLILIFVVRPRWADLIDSYRCTEDLLDTTFFSRLRRISCVAVAVLIIWVR